MTTGVGAPSGTVSELTTRLDALRQEVRAYLCDEINRGLFVPQSDAWMTGIDPAFSRRLAERGWVGMTIPRQYGGGGLSPLERFVVIEELLVAGAPVAAHWIADRQMASAILAHGTAEQKQTYLPGIARAERFFAIGMSEPDAGSDLASVRARATEVTDGWRISGTKIWTSGAHVATNLIVLLRTDPESSRHQGLSQFIVDLPHPAITIRPIITIDGGHHFNEVVFDDAVVPASAMLGEQGDGWRQVTSELSTERSGPERILSTSLLLLDWAKSPGISEIPGALLELSRLISRVVVLRRMSFSIAQRLAAGDEPRLQAAMVKDMGTELEKEVIEVVRRFTSIEPDRGVAGLSSLLAGAVLHSPAFTLRGGTNEMLRSIVAKGWAKA